MKLIIPATARSFNQSIKLWYVYFRSRPIRRLSGTDKAVAISNSLNAFVSPSHLRGVALARSIPCSHSPITDRTHRMPGSYPSFPLSTNGGSSMICMAGQEVPDYRTIEHGPPLATDYLRGHSHPSSIPRRNTTQTPLCPQLRAVIGLLLAR